MAESQIAPLSARVSKNPTAKYRWMTPEQKAEVRRIRIEERATIDEIADRMRYSKSTIHHLVKDIPHPRGAFGLNNAERGKKSWEARRPVLLPAREVQPQLFQHLTTAKKGKLAELYFEAECILRGIEVSRPIVDCRYDYVVLVRGIARRIQIKWADGRASSRHGSIAVSLAQPRGARSGRPTTIALYDRSEIDFVVAYIPTLAQFVVIGPTHFHKKADVRFRIDEPRNGQAKLVKFVRDFIWNENSLS